MTANQDTTPLAAPLWVRCEFCGERHVAEYSHEGQWDQGAIFAVVCHDLTDYYTSEAVFRQ